MGSMSLTIIFGLPCSLWIVSMNVVETVLSLKRWESAQKCVYLFSLSTITMMTLFPSDFGNPVMKSMETSSQHWIGMANGCKRPGVLIFSTWFCWKTKNSSINLWRSVLRPTKKKIPLDPVIGFQKSWVPSYQWGVWFQKYLLFELEVLT